MVQAQWALTLLLLLVALPAQEAGAAPWGAQAVALEHEAEQQEGRQAVPGPGESSRASHTAGPEYQDGRGQSSRETSKVLHEILRELKKILGGVNSLSMNSALSRRSASPEDSRAAPGAGESKAKPGPGDSRAQPGSGDSRAQPGPGDSRAQPGSGDSRAQPGPGDSRAQPGAAADTGAEPNAALGRADTNAVNANSFQQYCVEGIVAVLGSMLLGMVLCCVLHVWRKRKK